MKLKEIAMRNREMHKQKGSTRFQAVAVQQIEGQKQGECNE
jgi:hypothetical protein